MIDERGLGTSGLSPARPCSSRTASVPGILPFVSSVAFEGQYPQEVLAEVGQFC